MNETLECWEASFNNDKGPSNNTFKTKIEFPSKVPDKNKCLSGVMS